MLKKKYEKKNNQNAVFFSDSLYGKMVATFSPHSSNSIYDKLILKITKKKTTKQTNKPERGEGIGLLTLVS